jgi:hypothetical protein
MMRAILFASATVKSLVGTALQDPWYEDSYRLKQSKRRQRQPQAVEANDAQTQA